MSLPTVAIVGRPNVGKSSLLNCLVGKRIAIVDPTAGITRDRVSAPVPVAGGYVEIVDTGGFGIADADDLTEHVAAQINYAVAAARLILLVVDAREGVVPLDKAVAEQLRRREGGSGGGPAGVVPVANKVDDPAAENLLGEFEALGFGPALPVSALHRRGIGALLEEIARRVDVTAAVPDEPVMKLAIVGKRNVGKSTFINALAGAPRVIVSEVPGTTRDSVDVLIELDGRKLLAIDTAGLRKRRKMTEDVEYYSRHRALRSIRRADVVGLMIDATEPIGRVEKQLAGVVAELFKPTVLVVNKWDLAADRAEAEEYGPYLARQIPELAYAPVALATARDGVNVREVVGVAADLCRQARTRVGTGELNVAVEAITARHAPRAKGSPRPPKIYYATQVATAPPTIVLFVNDVEAFDVNYERYLVNALRERTPFAEVPIRLLLRQRPREDRRGGGKPAGKAPQKKRPAHPHAKPKGRKGPPKRPRGKK